MIDDPDTVVNIYQHPVHHLFITCSILVLHLFCTLSMCAERVQKVYPGFVVLPPRGFDFPSARR